MEIADDLCGSRRRRCPCIAFSSFLDLASQAPSVNVIVFIETLTDPFPSHPPAQGNHHANLTEAVFQYECSCRRRVPSRVEAGWLSGRFGKLNSGRKISPELRFRVLHRQPELFAARVHPYLDGQVLGNCLKSSGHHCGQEGFPSQMKPVLLGYSVQY